MLNKWKKRKRKKNTSKKLSKFNVTGKLKESHAQNFFIKYNFEESKYLEELDVGAPTVPNEPTDYLGGKL